MNARIETARHTWRICQECARAVYIVDPLPDYVDRVARILLMIAAHESGGFRDRKQIGVRDGVGGAGLWQVQRNSIQDSLSRTLARHPVLMGRVELFAGVTVHGLSADALWQMMRTAGGDRLCCAFARLHLLGRAGVIPADPVAQAAYCKREYNSEAGAATAELYLAAFQRWYPFVTESQP